MLLPELRHKVVIIPELSPVGQWVTHCGVPLYGHTDDEVDGAAERDPDQRSLKIN